MKRKWLAVGIILLFVGVTIAPTINFNTVKASTDDDLVKVTTESFGSSRRGAKTVTFTKQQFIEVEKSINDIINKLRKITSRAETIEIFKEAVVVLNEYGLLPRGMSIEQAQELVLKRFPVQKNIRFPINTCDDEFYDENFYCYVTGNTSLTYFEGFFPISILHFFFWDFFERLPFCFVNKVGLGYAGGFESHTQPAVGFLFTDGTDGIKRWDGKFLGGFNFSMWVTFFHELDTCPGILGFTGIKTNINGRYFFVGSALMVKIRDWL